MHFNTRAHNFVYYMYHIILADRVALTQTNDPAGGEGKRVLRNVTLM